MYIRKNTSKKNKSEYSSYKLVESVRIDGKPRQRLVLNLGSSFDLPEEQWKELANRIEEIVNGVCPLLPASEEVERLAGIYAREVTRKLSAPAQGHDASGDSAEYHDVDIHSMKHRDARTVGAEAVSLHALKELQVEECLKSLDFNPVQVASALGLIVGRAVFPASERATLEWLQNRSALGDLLGVDYSRFDLNRLYRVSDQLMSKKSEIEAWISKREDSLFGLDETLVLYDLTNTYFEGAAAANPKAARGHSKEKRSDCPLVTLGLVLDGRGFLRRSRFFEGNVSESSTLEEMVGALRGPEAASPIVVLDAGIATEANVEWLKSKGFSYVVVSRRRKQAEFDEDLAVSIREEKGNLVEAYYLESKDTGELELHCRSSGRVEKERAIKSLFMKRFEEDLNSLKDGLAIKSRMKKHDKVMEKIGRLKEKHSRVSGFYDIAVAKDAKGINAVGLEWKCTPRKNEKLEGTYCLRTNVRGLDEAALWSLYVTLTKVESAFRCMKGELGMRPVHHQKQTRVDGHIFITILAYHAVQNTRHRLNAAGDNSCWTTVRGRMASQVRITTQFRTRDGKKLSVRKSSEADSFQQNIYKALHLDMRPGGTEVMRI